MNNSRLRINTSTPFDTEKANKLTQSLDRLAHRNRRLIASEELEAINKRTASYPIISRGI